MCGIQLWEKDNDDYVISDVPLWILSGTLCVCMHACVRIFIYCVVL